MNLQEAIQSTREGNFVSHKSFDSNQSMHMWQGELFYEDGANLSKNNTIEFLQSEKWTNDGWFV